MSPWEKFPTVVEQAVELRILCISTHGLKQPKAASGMLMMYVEYTFDAIDLDSIGDSLLWAKIKLKIICS